MLLSARFLNDVANVNSFEYALVAEFTEGDPASVYFQLIDASLDKAIDGFVPSGRRYVPASGATLQVTVESIDDSKEIVRLATQPFANDGSIWKVDFLATDKIRGTANLRLRLTEGAVVRTGLVKSGLRIHSTTCL
jgi:hypothetical protein